MYGKSRYLSHFKELYYTFIVSECQMNMKIRQGEKFPDQSFLQKNILFGAVFSKTTHYGIFVSYCILQEKMLINKMCNVIPHQMNLLSAFNTQENNFQTIPRSYYTK